MEKQSFDSKIWRFNGVIIALAGVLAIFILLLGAASLGYDFFKSMTRDVQREDMVNVSSNDDIEEYFEYEMPTMIPGTNVMLVPLSLSQRYEYNSYKDKQVSSNRNLLFFDTKTNHHHWLFPHNDYLIRFTTIQENNHSQIANYAQNSHLQNNGFLEDETNIIANTYQVIKRDTDGNERLSEGDETTFALSKPNGSGYVEILEGIEDILSTQTNQEGQLVVVYQKSNQSFVATISLIDLKLVQNLPLPNIPG